MNLVNLTPHEVVVYDLMGREVVLRLLPSGSVARATEQTVQHGDVMGVPVVKTTMGDVTGVSHGHGSFIVSALVGQKLADQIKRAVYSPDTGPESVVRDPQGKILGVRRLRVYLPGP